MLRKKDWRIDHPYHYLMDILVDKYTRYLERVKSTGDIMPEGRRGKKDTVLQQAYEDVRANGLYYVSSQQIVARIPSKALKFRYKPDNVAGLQLADLIAHPSHMTIRERLGHPVELGAFAKRVREVLIRSKYDRSATDKIVGYGMKWLP